MPSTVVYQFTTRCVLILFAFCLTAIIDHQSSSSSHAIAVDSLHRNCVRPHIITATLISTHGRPVIQSVHHLFSTQVVIVRALTSAEASCAACGAPANNTCRGCLDGIDAEGAAASRTLYCGVDCQKKHWGSHKTVCKQLKVRKELYRAGDLIKKVYYTFRAHAFEVPVRKIEKTGDEIHLHAALNQPRVLHRMGCFTWDRTSSEHSKV